MSVGLCLCEISGLEKCKIVMGEEALLQAMLTAGEYTSLCCAVLSHNAFPDRMQTLYEQAKK